MSSEPGSYASLREYYNVSVFDQDPATLARDLAKESDRAAVVIGASILEDALKAALRLKFTSLDEKALKNLGIFHHSGELGSFSSKIKIAYAMGVIDEQTVIDLTDIREMRNACAHSFKPIDFSTPQLANVCKRLFSSDRSLFQMEVKDRQDLRNGFTTAFSTLMTVISHGSREEAQAILRENLNKIRARPQPLPGTHA